ncbi:hypothetical protein A2154_01325 [Candidatus Gottesmanbacteria bacterium RBG_16_43_7]|uniref:OmpR/PhoB-type domain-containing protein n=1 Tax=Candidatus Gottesmanbacteria bacterium RBG_16_43_7 TaxID=1798373 RepID=A0A1F5Z9D1_9BACT|nr:MAG: hypothetical protein A2154_01325 [Candidatus Gottesmanbacteria bacterium RBG_16_43_7]
MKKRPQYQRPVVKLSEPALLLLVLLSEQGGNICPSIIPAEIDQEFAIGQLIFFNLIQLFNCRGKKRIMLTDSGWTYTVAN